MSHIDWRIWRSDDEDSARTYAEHVYSTIDEAVEQWARDYDEEYQEQIAHNDDVTVCVQTLRNGDPLGDVKRFTVSACVETVYTVEPEP